VHLLGAIRSISSSWREKAGDEYLESELTQPGAESPLEQISTNLNPERIYEAKEKLEQLMRLFTTDEVASEVVKLFGLGYAAKEIQARLDISSREFDAITKRIRRKLDSQYGGLSARDS
jgi:DNA-directed RNA polymerase specialized sigma24 family protein